VPIRVVASPYGRAAAEALRAEIARAKQASPLAPVTVVVPGNSVGVATRRLLASGELGPVSAVGAGVIGVNFLTGYRLAELLAAPRLAASGRRPVSTAVVAAAIRRVLASNPGPLFASVAAHPATEEALVGAHRELADLEAASLDLLARQSRRASEVVRIHRLVKEQLASSWYDEHDLMRAAREIVEGGAPLVVELGSVVVHLPQRMSTPLARLLGALAAHNEIVLVAGFTGVPKADREVVAGVTRVGGVIGPDPSITPEHATAVCSTSDADDEVRSVVRGIVDAMREGVPLERMAVVIGNNEPYARLLHDHLELAGVAHNGVSVRTLADSVLGRGLVRLLALPDHDFRRDDVFALLAGVPVLDERVRPVPAIHWERISREAGIVRGLGEWDARLARYAASLVETDDDPSGWAERERGRTHALQRFITTLAGDLDNPPSSWSGLARWTHELVARWIGSEATRVHWSDFEQEAARRVDAAVDRLGGLDDVESAPTLDVFRRSLALELDAARDRVGRLGEGVLVGSAPLVLGVELDRLWVCGLAEGVFPAPPADDPLLADADRQALAGELTLRRDRIGDDQRALLAAFAATTGDCTLCYPRGDLRRNTEHVPSRFLLDTIEALTGRREIDAAIEAEKWFTLVPSYVYGLAHAAFPPTRHELDVRAALARDPRLAEVLEVARGVALVNARRGPAFTRFDGNLAHRTDVLAARSPSSDGVAISATRLESWVRCPHAYFARYLLHLKPVELPEELIQLSPLDKGNIVHATLERFLAELDGRPDVGRPWRAEQRERVHEILRDACDDIEARGLGGKRLLWARARRELHAQLDVYLDFDADFRRVTGADTLATELAFGRGGPHPAVTVPLSDGRTVRIVGSIDRVDRLADGRLAVIDYKTGSSKSYSTVSHDAPLQNGERLQLPIYAHAARTLLGNGSAEPVLAEYWFVLQEPRRPRGYVVDPEVECALDAALRVIVSGIDAGWFPARPSEPGFSVYTQCEYCDPDGLGTTDSHRAWLRKRTAPELVDYVALIGEGPAVAAESGQP
jgi:ATP-dependent helicase/nuclease subunit B